MAAPPYQNVQQIYDDIAEEFLDNDERLITPLRVRTVLDGIVEYFARPTIKVVRHTGDANYNVAADDDVLILDEISANRTIALPATPADGRVITFFNQSVSTTLYWQVNTPFFDGNTVRQQLGNGQQQLMYDLVGTRWILLGGL